MLAVALGVRIARVDAEILMLVFRMHARLTDIHDELRRAPRS